MTKTPYFKRLKNARPLCGRVERREGRAIIRGFSLIELIVVLVLMAVLASLATLSVRGVIARQRLGRAIEVIEQFDTALRRSARDQRRQVAGVIDRGRGRLTIDPSGDQSRTFTLPRQVSIDAIRFGPVSASRQGSQVIANRDGSSPSYALRLTTADTRRWVFLVGGSGQVVEDFNDMSVNLALGMR
nr:type II secretion system protein [Rhodopirellula sp. SM50]